MHLPIWNRWRCITHECGSYNFNNLTRHEITTCNIVTELTVGIIKPKSFGGFNGDLGRNYIPEFQNSLREKQLQEAELEKWKNYRSKRERYNFKYPRTYDQKLKRIFRDKRTKDQNR